MRRVARILRALGLAWLAWRLLGPDLPPRYRGVQERPITVPGRTVFVGRRELFVRETGRPDGPVVVLAHGWAFDGEMTYYKLIPLLAPRYRLVIPDMRTHGKSDRVRGRFEIDDLADDLAGVLDALGVRRAAAVVGYSMGGMVAQAFARRFPGRTRHLVLAATAARPIPRRRAAARVAFLLARALARVSKKDTTILTHRYLLRHGWVEPRHSRWLWEALLNRDATLFYESGNALWRFDSRSWLGGIDVPTLVIVPTDDRLVDAETQRELVDLIPGATLVEVIGAGHEAILSRPEEIAKVIDAFIGDGGEG